MNEVLKFFREEVDSRFKDVPDNQLAEFIYNEYPQFLKDPGFRSGIKEQFAVEAKVPSTTPDFVSDEARQRGRISSAGQSAMRSGGVGTGGTVSTFGRFIENLGPYFAGMDPSGQGLAIPEMEQAQAAYAEQQRKEKLTPLQRELEIQQNPIYQAGQQIAGGAREAFQPNPKYAGEFFADVLPSSAGGMVPTFAASMLAGPAGGMLQYGGSAAESVAQDAIRAGRIDLANRAAALAFPVAAISEGILGAGTRFGSRLLRPTESAAARVAGNTAEEAAAAAAKAAEQRLLREEFDLLRKGVGRRVGEVGLREAGQESIEQVGENVIASTLAPYDPQRGLLQGVPESAAAGFLLGGAVGGAEVGLDAARRRDQENRLNNAYQNALNQLASRSFYLGTDGGVYGTPFQQSSDITGGPDYYFREGRFFVGPSGTRISNAERRRLEQEALTQAATTEPSVPEEVVTEQRIGQYPTEGFGTGVIPSQQELERRAERRRQQEEAAAQAAQQPTQQVREETVQVPEARQPVVQEGGQGAQGVGRVDRPTEVRQGAVPADVAGGPEVAPEGQLKPSARPSDILPPRSRVTAPPRPERNGRDTSAQDAWDEQYGDMRRGGRTHNDDGTPYQPTLVDEVMVEFNNGIRSASDAHSYTLRTIGSPFTIGARNAVGEMLDGGWVWDDQLGRMVDPSDKTKMPWIFWQEKAAGKIAAPPAVAPQAAPAAPASQKDVTKPLKLFVDGVEGQTVPFSQVPNGNPAFEYALGTVEQGGVPAVYRRKISESGTYGGWRWETDAGKISSPTAAAPQVAPATTLLYGDSTEIAPDDTVEISGKAFGPEVSKVLHKARIRGAATRNQDGSISIRVTDAGISEKRGRSADAPVPRVQQAGFALNDTITFRSLPSGLVRVERRNAQGQESAPAVEIRPTKGLFSKVERVVQEAPAVDAQTSTILQSIFGAVEDPRFARFSELFDKVIFKKATEEEATEFEALDKSLTPTESTLLRAAYYRQVGPQQMRLMMADRLTQAGLVVDEAEIDNAWDKAVTKWVAKRMTPKGAKTDFALRKAQGYIVTDLIRKAQKRGPVASSTVPEDAETSPIPEPASGMGPAAAPTARTTDIGEASASQASAEEALFNADVFSFLAETVGTLERRRRGQRITDDELVQILTGVLRQYNPEGLDALQALDAQLYDKLIGGIQEKVKAIYKQGGSRLLAELADAYETGNTDVISLLSRPWSTPIGLSVAGVQSHLALRYGIRPDSGMVGVISIPGADFNGRLLTLRSTGQPIGIQINAATVSSLAEVDKVLQHELAEMALAQGVARDVLSQISAAELAEIRSTVAELGYDPSNDTEVDARIVEQLVAAYRNRNWFQRVVANVLAWANSKGLKITRLAAELIAARAVAAAQADVVSGARKYNIGAYSASEILIPVEANLARVDRAIGGIASRESRVKTVPIGPDAWLRDRSINRSKFSANLGTVLDAAGMSALGMFDGQKVVIDYAYGRNVAEPIEIVGYLRPTKRSAYELTESVSVETDPFATAPEDLIKLQKSDEEEYGPAARFDISKGANIMSAPYAVSIYKPNTSRLLRSNDPNDVRYAQLVDQFYSGTKGAAGELESLLMEQAARGGYKKLRMYHGTPGGVFNTFRTFLETRFGLFGSGAYFTSDRDVATEYAVQEDRVVGGTPVRQKVYEVFLRVDNPLNMDADADPSMWSKSTAVRKAAGELSKSYENRLESEVLQDLVSWSASSISNSALEEIRLMRKLKPFFDAVASGSVNKINGYQPTNEEVFRAIVDETQWINEVDFDASLIRQMLLEMGVDGITHVGGGRTSPSDERRHRVIIAFDPSQIKSADLVTYDQNGYVIPLWKRFNEEALDIRESRTTFTKREKVADELGQPGLLPDQQDIIESSAAAQAAVVPASIKATITAAGLSPRSRTALSWLGKVFDLSASPKPLSSLNPDDTNTMQIASAVMGQVDRVNKNKSDLILKLEKLLEQMLSPRRAQILSELATANAAANAAGAASSGLTKDFRAYNRQEILTYAGTDASLKNAVTRASDAIRLLYTESKEINKAFEVMAENVPDAVIAQAKTLGSNQPIFDYVINSKMLDGKVSKSVIDALTVAPATGKLAPLQSYRGLASALRTIKDYTADVSKAKADRKAFEALFAATSPSTTAKAKRVDIEDYARRYRALRNAEQDAVDRIRSLSREIEALDNALLDTIEQIGVLDSVMGSTEYTNSANTASDLLNLFAPEILGVPDPNGVRHVVGGTPYVIPSKFDPETDRDAAGRVLSLSNAVNARLSQIASGTEPVDPVERRTLEHLRLKLQQFAGNTAGNAALRIGPFNPARLRRKIPILRSLISRRHLARIIPGRLSGELNMLNAAGDSLEKALDGQARRDKTVGINALNVATSRALASHPGMDPLVWKAEVLNEILNANQKDTDFRVTAGMTTPFGHTVTKEDIDAAKLQARFVHKVYSVSTAKDRGGVLRFFPNMIMEGNRLRLPFVTGAMTTPRRLVRDEVEGGPVYYAKQIEQALENPDEASRKAEIERILNEPNAFTLMARRYVWETNSEFKNRSPYAKIYRKLAVDWWTNKTAAPTNLDELVDQIAAFVPGTANTQQEVRDSLINEIVAVSKASLESQRTSIQEAGEYVKNGVGDEGFSAEVFSPSAVVSVVDSFNQFTKPRGDMVAPGSFYDYTLATDESQNALIVAAMMPLRIRQLRALMDLQRELMKHKTNLAQRMNLNPQSVKQDLKNGKLYLELSEVSELLQVLSDALETFKGRVSAPNIAVDNGLLRAWNAVHKALLVNALTAATGNILFGIAGGDTAARVMTRGYTPRTGISTLAAGPRVLLNIVERAFANNPDAVRFIKKNRSKLGALGARMMRQAELYAEIEAAARRGGWRVDEETAAERAAQVAEVGGFRSPIRSRGELRDSLLNRIERKLSKRAIVRVKEALFRFQPAGDEVANDLNAKTALTNLTLLFQSGYNIIKNRAASGVPNWDNWTDPNNFIRPEEAKQVAGWSPEILFWLKENMAPAGSLEYLLHDYYKRVEAAKAAGTDPEAVAPLADEDALADVMIRILSASNLPADSSRADLIRSSSGMGQALSFFWGFPGWINNWLDSLEGFSSISSERRSQLERLAMPVIYTMALTALLALSGLWPNELLALFYELVNGRPYNVMTAREFASAPTPAALGKLMAVSLARMVPYAGEYIAGYVGATQNKPSMTDLSKMSIPLGVLANFSNALETAWKTGDIAGAALGLTRSTLPILNPIVNRIAPQGRDAINDAVRVATRNAGDLEIKTRPGGGGGFEPTEFSSLIKRAVAANANGDAAGAKALLQRAADVKAKSGVADPWSAVKSSLKSQAPDFKTFGRTISDGERAGLLGRMSANQRDVYQTAENAVSSLLSGIGTKAERDAASGGVGGLVAAQRQIRALTGTPKPIKAIRKQLRAAMPKGLKLKRSRGTRLGGTKLRLPKGTSVASLSSSRLLRQGPRPTVALGRAYREQRRRGAAGLPLGPMTYGGMPSVARGY